MARMACFLQEILFAFAFITAFHESSAIQSTSRYSQDRKEGCTTAANRSNANKILNKSALADLSALNAGGDAAKVVAAAQVAEPADLVAFLNSPLEAEAATPASVPLILATLLEAEPATVVPAAATEDADAVPVASLFEEVATDVEQTPPQEDFAATAAVQAVVQKAAEDAAMAAASVIVELAAGETNVAPAAEEEEEKAATQTEGEGIWRTPDAQRTSAHAATLAATAATEATVTELQERFKKSQQAVDSATARIQAFERTKALAADVEDGDAPIGAFFSMSAATDVDVETPTSEMKLEGDSAAIPGAILEMLTEQIAADEKKLAENATSVVVPYATANSTAEPKKQEAKAHKKRGHMVAMGVDPSQMGFMNMTAIRLKEKRRTEAAAAKAARESAAHSAATAA